MSRKIKWLSKSTLIRTIFLKKQLKSVGEWNKFRRNFGKMYLNCPIITSDGRLRESVVTN